MAEKAPTPSEALKNVEQQLVCPVCLDRFIQPRTLPCLHSFCHDCLGQLPIELQEGKHFVACPVCRQTTQQPENGVNGFQSAFLINHLLELHQVLEKVCGTERNSCENCSKEQANGYCKQCSMLLCQTCIEKHNEWVKFTSHQILGMKDIAATASKLVPLKELPTIECSSHAGKPLEVYCDTCDKLICHLCTTAKAHRNHEYEPLIDAFPRHQQQIVASLDQVKKKLAIVTDAIRDLKTKEQGFFAQVRNIKEEIEATVQQLINLLKESEVQLMGELDQVTESYVKNISTRTKEADVSFSQLKSCEEFTEEQLRIGSQQEILVMKKQMIERMGFVCSQVTENSMRPLEKINVRFAKSSSVLEACKNFGNVVRFGQLEVGHNCKVTFDIYSSIPLSSELVSCKFSPVTNPKKVSQCMVSQVAPGHFEIFDLFNVIISSNILHQLMVQVRGTDILDAPLQIMLPRIAEKPFPCLSTPAGIAFTKSSLVAVVVESSKNCITILNSTNGKRIISYGQRGDKLAQFNSPLGIAVDEAGLFVVVDHENHRLQVLKISPTGNSPIDKIKALPVQVVGSEGFRPLQFCYPTDIAVHQNGKFYIVDGGNSRVQVLNADYSYSHCFGSKGARPGAFANPRRITIDSNGMLYVSDCGNNRIQKFTPEGDLLAIIDEKENDGPLCSPCGLCFYGGVLYVTEIATVKTVCMFNTSGKFLGYIGGDKDSTLTNPWFITSDSNGVIYINDNSTGEILTYCKAEYKGIRFR